VAVLIPAYDPDKVIVGMAACFTQIYDPLNPPELPPDELELGAEWPAPWTPVGATQEGLTFGGSKDTQDITIEEQITPVDKTVTAATYTMGLVLSEDSLDTMVLAYGGGVIEQTAATATKPGVRKLKLSTGLTYFAFAFETRNSFELPRRVLVPKVVSVGEAETAFRRAEEQRLYEVSFESLVAPEDLDIREMYEPATGP